MKLYRILIIIFLFSIDVSADTMQLIGKTNKNPIEYKVNEKIIFSLEIKNLVAKKNTKYYIKWIRTGEDGKQFSKIEQWKNKPITIITSLNKPGFIRILATVVDENKNYTKVVFDGGAGVEIEKLKGTLIPKDFYQFWNKQKKKLAEIPLKSIVVKVPAKGNSHLYEVKVACAGPRPVTGYLRIPKNAKKKSMKAHIIFQGYGVPHLKRMVNANADKIIFNVNAHGMELSRDKEYYLNFAKKIRNKNYNYAFDPNENRDPEKAYFNGMALRVMRSLEFIKTLDEWNGKDLIVSGESQGGLQTIWAAGLDKDVTEAYPSMPWCCDLGGIKYFNRHAAYSRIPYVKELEYYDGIQFAKDIKCFVKITRAGLGDYVCPPSGIAVFYNRLNCPKEIVWLQAATHKYIPPNCYLQKYIIKDNYNLYKTN